MSEQDSYSTDETIGLPGAEVGSDEPGLPDEAAESTAAKKNKGRKKAKKAKQPMTLKRKLVWSGVGSIAAFITLAGLMGGGEQPSGAQQQTQPQNNTSTHRDDFDDHNPRWDDSESTPNLDAFDDFGFEDARGLQARDQPEPTRLEQLERDRINHRTRPSDEQLREEYYRDQFNDRPEFEPPVEIVEVERQTQQFDHSESECINKLRWEGQHLDIDEHRYCLSLVERRVAREAALRSLKYMEQPVEYWVEKKRPIINVDIPEPVIQVEQPRANRETRDREPAQRQSVDYNSLYYLMDIIGGDTVKLRGANTGRVFTKQVGDRLAHNGVLESIDGDTVVLKWPSQTVRLALW